MIDLSTCTEGTLLRSSKGEILEYVAPTPYKPYLDHVVKYADGSYGTRTNDGFVFAKNRKPETDHDIIEIIF